MTIDNHNPARNHIDEMLEILRDRSGRDRFNYVDRTKAADYVREFVKTVKYKEGTRFWFDDFLGAINIKISYQTKDVHNGLSININGGVPLDMDKLIGPSRDEYLKNMIRKLVHDAEKHEADEWLLFDGVREFDPHRESIL